MRLAPTLVAVKKITCAVARSQFSEAELEQIARAILQVEGIINPPLVRRTGLDTYEVVAGHFEYYAAVKARELNPMKGEVVGTFVLDEDNESALLAQVQHLRQAANVPPAPVEAAGQAGVSHQDLQKLLLQLETSLEHKFNQLLQAKLTTLSTQLEQVKTALEQQPVATHSARKSEIPVGDEGDYASKNVKQLQAIAKQRGLKNYSKLNKDKLLQLLST